MAGVSRSVDRVHIVLVPGFAGFDALGAIEYYAGTTDRFARWFGSGGPGGQTAVLHYFDNLPTAGVATRAERLRTYLATRIARREIQDGDRIALVGHSTGGLDIRRLLFPAGKMERWVDGGDRTEEAPRNAIPVDQGAILDKVSRVVFLSVPQYGTNIADWVRAHAPLRRLLLAELGWGIRRRRGPEVIAGFLGLLQRVAQEPDLVLAARDALIETAAPRDDPIRRANAEEAGSQLRLWVQHTADDFGAIDDLASFTEPPRDSSSPAHYTEEARCNERKTWRDKSIETMSVATVARRAFNLVPGRLAAPLAFHDPRTWLIRRLADDAGRMDLTYLLTNRACAGGRFKIADTTFPPQFAALCDDVAQLNDSLFDDAKLGPSGPRHGQPLEVWDNDGIVNTASMLWPNGGDTRLVAADHLDIVGHFMRRPAPSDDSGRAYASVDALKSHTEFTQEEFDRVWKAVFDFCVS